MLQTNSNVLTRLTINCPKYVNSAIALEFVRWRRKPRTVPVAKSKLFRVPERTQQTPEEKAELLRLHNNYKLQMRCVRQYFREEVLRNEDISTADHIVLTPEQKAAEIERCMQINEKWNQEIALIRNERLEKERADRAALIKERLEAASIREEERRERVEAIVKREKELAKQFITREKLEEAIELALANPVDYNFSVDLHGNIYRGRTTLPGSSGPPANKQQSIDNMQLEAVN